MRCIFVCYRRTDHWAAGNLSRDMRDEFGEQQVFRDKEDLRGGLEWRRTIGAKLTRDSIVLAVIGPLWTEARSDDGHLKLADRDDPLRMELTTAFASGATVIPILLDQAKMPEPHELPRLGDLQCQ